MKQSLILVLSVCFAVLTTTCSKDDSTETVDHSIWDIDKVSPPKFVSVNYIELSKIGNISKFRSGYGHDYSDGVEDCRSMKHYFAPFDDLDWSVIKIFSPINGVIKRLEQEVFGVKIEIESTDYPAFRILIFHVNLISPLNIDDKVVAGQQLGTHIREIAFKIMHS